MGGRDGDPHMGLGKAWGPDGGLTSAPEVPQNLELALLRSLQACSHPCTSPQKWQGCMKALICRGGVNTWFVCSVVTPVLALEKADVFMCVCGEGSKSVTLWDQPWDTLK